MGLSEDEVGGIIQAFACAALDPSQWLPAMRALSDAAGAECYALELTDLNTGVAVMECSIELGKDVLDHYEERIFHINPRVTRAMSLPVGVIKDDRYLLREDDPHTPEFRDWLKQTPYQFIQGAKVLDNNGHIGFFTANYADKHGPGGDQQEQLHRTIFPHLINFIQAGRALSGNKLRNDVVNVEALAQDRPFALLDRAGRLVEGSVGFEAIIRSKHVLGLRDGVLVASHAQHRREVAGFLESALKTGGISKSPLPIRLVGPNCRRGVVLRAVPIAPNNDIFDIFRPAALITLTDLDRPHRVRRNELAALFGLTEREADVAALISEGLSTERVSHALKISEYTVRQHLKAVFGKIGVSRQSELVSIVSRLT